MREIKFRAWDKVELKWYHYTLNDLLNREVLRPPFTTAWCEYTGLKDKNGKEIYEGDILKRKCKKDPKEWGEFNATVEYQHYGFLPFTSGLCDEKSWEIIGNIYENPKLIKEE